MFELNVLNICLIYNAIVMHIITHSYECDMTLTYDVIILMFNVCFN